jgi:Zn-dependent peptidase ImmA (M78 family)
MAKKLTPFNLPIPGWNERRMTSDDFDSICEREGIQAISEHSCSTKALGFFTWTIDGTPTIFISPRQKGRERVRTQFHELGHYFLHSRQKHTFKTLEDEEAKLTPAQEWAEVEANVAALIATAPGFFLNYLIRRMTPGIGRHNWLESKEGRR